MLSCTQLTKSYGKSLVLSSVTLTLEPGECACIVGAGGSGKSTLLRLLIGLEQPASGSIKVDGVDLKTLPPPVLQLYRGRVGLITQEPQMLTRMTVAENLAYPLEIRGTPDATIVKKTKDMLALLRLTNASKLLAHELSPSERALCCLGRALISDPMIVLADEPLAPLDGDQSDIALTLLKEAHARGASVLLFTQGTSLAHRLGARVLHLENGSIEAPAQTAHKHRAPAHSAHHASTKSSEPVIEQEKPVEPEHKEATVAHAPAPKKADHPPRSKGKIKITSIGS
jgi:ABC-type methionine transport system ATPase subunit